MAVVNQPPILASSFAVNGDKNTIPATNNGTEGLASLSLGFPSITSQPVSQGGIPPQREDFNGIFNLITNFLMFLQNGSVFAYSSTLDYQPPAIVYGNNALYRCIATNGANTSAGVQPLSNTNYWKPLIPVGAITISGNVITITNETGTQTQYTIDTINNPPAQSDTSNKIVTSAWVKAYAPSKSGSGAYGTWNININGNAKNDSSGQQINTTYIKSVTGSNATLTITKGNGTTSSVTINNVANANKAKQDGDGNTISSTYLKNTGGGMEGNYCLTDTIRIKNGGDNTTTGTGFVVATDYAGLYDWSLNNAIIKLVNGEGYATTTTPSTSDNSTRIATTAFVNNYAPNKTGNGASGTWNITANKAKQDGDGNTISSTYLKNTGGGMEGNYYFTDTIRIKNGGNNNTTGVGLVVANDYTGFQDWSTNDAIIRVVNGAGYATTTTPSTSDNSTRIATTAFVKSLFTASKATNGWHKEASTGMIYQWGAWEINSIEASASTNVTFPISFPNKCLFVIPSVYNAAEDQIGYFNVTQTGCSFKKGLNDDTIGRNGLYLVIGY